MRVIEYNRSEIYNFSDLPYSRQEENEGHEESMYVKGPHGDFLPLDMFQRTEGRYHGVYGLTYFSGYGVILSKCNESAVVAYFVS